MLLLGYSPLKTRDGRNVLKVWQNYNKWGDRFPYMVRVECRCGWPCCPGDDHFDVTSDGRLFPDRLSKSDIMEFHHDRH